MVNNQSDGADVQLHQRRCIFRKAQMKCQFRLKEFQKYLYKIRHACCILFYSPQRNGKSLVKHLLVADLSKRYGNLKNGAADVKNHRWFANLDWNLLTQKKLPVPYKPVVKAPNDTSNFSSYPESDTQSPALKPADDPFLEW